ncbi:hypothetical protein COCNU_09G001180 [Cocos nucifera]|uniref:Uncharacterized protein n=1 Tax=Cocos nucifera TaxID=13894 RepID=A0A8K0IKL4_COCNU|nr:hypothetical protein COCNU_09G001180 [Cocos nucifera]
MATLNHANPSPDVGESRRKSAESGKNSGGRKGIGSAATAEVIQFEGKRRGDLEGFWHGDWWFLTPILSKNVSRSVRIGFC